jgi:hypothetical protein
MEFVADGADNCSHLNSASHRMMAILQNDHHINTSAADANDLGIYNDIFLSRYDNSQSKLIFARGPFSIFFPPMCQCAYVRAESCESHSGTTVSETARCHC